MSSLLSDLQKASLVADFQSAIDTFLRPLTVYQESTKTVIISDPNYNPLLYSNAQNSTSPVQNIPNYTTISGRILYDKNQEWSYMKPYVGQGANEAQLKVKDQTARSVRIKVDYSGMQLLQTAKKVEIDGNMFNLESIARPHGLFSSDYYTFYFVRSM